MTDRFAELYRELGRLTRDRDQWEARIPYVSSLLSCESEVIRAKAIWLLGEMGLMYPSSVQDAVPAIASFLDSPEPLLRERAVIALGRIGRGSYPAVAPYWEKLFRFASDPDAKVRLGFVWASENIAVNTPYPYERHMPVFERLLHDADGRVRMEAPEMFRVLGKRRPEFVLPYAEQLRNLSETDPNRVVRIHCQGALRAAGADRAVSRPAGQGPGACGDHRGGTPALSVQNGAVHHMNLDPDPYEMIKNGQKTIELRLYDEKRRKIRPGDEIVFANNVTGETLRTQVLKLHCFSSFEELYQTLPLLQCGYTGKDVAQARPSDMERYYSAGEQAEYGVVGIELFLENETADEA